MRAKSSTWNVLAVVVVVLLGLCGVTAGAFAHEGHHHQAMGVVKMIHEDHLVLTLADEKERTFLLSAATRFLRGKVPTTRGDVAAGERAVVTFETKDGSDRALEVRLGEKKR